MQSELQRRRRRRYNSKNDSIDRDGYKVMQQGRIF